MKRTDLAVSTAVGMKTGATVVAMLAIASCASVGGETATVEPTNAQIRAGGIEGGLFIAPSDEKRRAFVESDPACRREAYALADRVDCLVLDQRALAQTLAAIDKKAKFRMQLLPEKLHRPDLYFAKDVGSRLKDDAAVVRYSWQGSVRSRAKPHAKLGTAMFFIRGDSLVGRITTDSAVYEIRPLEGGVHVIITVDPKKRPPLPLHPAAGDSGYKPGRRAAQGSLMAGAHMIETSIRRRDCQCDGESQNNGLAVPTITVEIMFEEGSVPLSTDLHALGAGYVVFTNQALTNSLVRATIFDVPKIRVIQKFVESKDSLKDLVMGDSQSGGMIGKVHSWREQDRADLVMLMTKGFGFYGYTISTMPFDPKLGFSLVWPEVGITELQVAHEIGHQLGADHQPDAPVADRSECFARAHVLVGATEHKTIMVWSGGTSEPHYSNPKVYWNEIDSSSATGVPDISDNACAIGRRAAFVANYMP